MSTITLHEGDNRESLRRLIDQGVQVHSVVCDPPYGLVSTVKRFGKTGSAEAKSNGATGVFKRASGGFMNQQWDASGIERDPEFWALIYDILLPGGYVLAFSSPRTGHWQACAMETAGFIMHPFFGWCYGQGFPKAHNAAMAINKTLGVQGGRGGPKSAAHAGWIERGAMRGDGEENHEGWQRPWMEDADKVAAAASKYLAGSPEAVQWDGWAYGAQSMKPALEPIYVGQKPFSEKNGALNLLKHGVGAMNIDGCRVQGNVDEMRGRSGTAEKGNEIYGIGIRNPTDEIWEPNSQGRHPANLLHDGSDDVVAMFPQSAGSGPARKLTRNQKDRDDGFGMDTAGATDAALRDAGTGSAARFFNSFPPDSDPIFYHGKATKADRAGSKHPTVKPIQLMRWLCRLVTPPGGTVLDPFGGSGTTGAAAQQEGFDCILMEAEPQFICDIRGRFGLPAPVADFDDFDALLEDDFSELL